MIMFSFFRKPKTETVQQACQFGHVTRYTANRLCVACAIPRRAEQTATEKDKESIL